MSRRDVDTRCANIISDLGDANSVAHGVASTALVAGLTLIDPRRLSPWQRFIYRAKVAGVTAWMMSAAFRDEPGARSQITVATFGVTMAASELGEALDATMHDGLARRGVKLPRLMLAALAVVVGAATWALSRNANE